MNIDFAIIKSGILLYHNRSIYQKNSVSRVICQIFDMPFGLFRATFNSTAFKKIQIHPLVLGLIHILLAKSVCFLVEISLKMNFLRENVQNINLFSPNLPPPKLSMYVFLCLILSLIHYDYYYSQQSTMLQQWIKTYIFKYFSRCIQIK